MRGSKRERERDEDRVSWQSLNDYRLYLISDWKKTRNIFHD